MGKTRLTTFGNLVTDKSAGEDAEDAEDEDDEEEVWDDMAKEYEDCCKLNGHMLNKKFCEVWISHENSE